MFQFNFYPSLSLSFNSFLTVTILLCLAATGTQANDALHQASKAACEKFKACALQEMAGSPDITPQMKQMLEGMIAGVCDSLMDYSDIKGQHELYQPAADCLNSMAQLSCEQLNDDITTPACAEYERRAEQYSQ
ncbi:hypothetical protein [Alteromonas flava]|uniref:hypothetical protein n=1 Tax=Alteromonas flava TaxID=2048003 RepID=UPI000C290A56|nr:hypothetical protein [Alteromonas flava]